MAERQDYDQKSEKTNNGELAAAYMCSPETAAEEFEISRQLLLPGYRAELERNGEQGTDR